MLLNTSIKNSPSEIIEFSKKISTELNIKCSDVMDIISVIKGYSSFEELDSLLIDENRINISKPENLPTFPEKITNMLETRTQKDFEDFIIEMDKREINILSIFKDKVVGFGKNIYFCDIQEKHVINFIRMFNTNEYKNLSHIKRYKTAKNILNIQFEMIINNKSYSIYIYTVPLDKKNQVEFKICLQNKSLSLNNFIDSDILKNKSDIKKLSFALKEISHYKNNDVLNMIAKIAGYKNWHVYNSALNDYEIKPLKRKERLINIINTINKRDVDNDTVVSFFNNITVWMYFNKITSLKIDKKNGVSILNIFGKEMIIENSGNSKLCVLILRHLLKNKTIDFCNDYYFEQHDMAIECFNIAVDSLRLSYDYNELDNVIEFMSFSLKSTEQYLQINLDSVSQSTQRFHPKE